MESDFSIRKEDLYERERLFLYILGKAGWKISMLHLNAIWFALWRFNPMVRRFVRFVASSRGPFSPDLCDIVHRPILFIFGWWFIPLYGRSESEAAMAGYVELTEKGRRAYGAVRYYFEEMAKKDDVIAALVSAIDMIVPLYVRLEWDELLFLLYTDETIKDFCKPSLLSKSVLERSEKIVDRLIEKGMFPEDCRSALLERVSAVS